MAGDTMTLEHAGLLEDQLQMPGYLVPSHDEGHVNNGNYSCCFCGVGDSGVISSKADKDTSNALDSCDSHSDGIKGLFNVSVKGITLQLESSLYNDEEIHVQTSQPIATPGGVVQGVFTNAESETKLIGREIRSKTANRSLIAQHFKIYEQANKINDSIVKKVSPTTGCVKFKSSLMRQPPAFPIHIQPSVLGSKGGERMSVDYASAIEQLADLLLAYRQENHRVLVYACGQVDYFTIFAMQEVFRLLGVRNLTGNAEHCLNAGAVHNEILTGQEGPFLTIDQAINGDNRFYLLNGWNGQITHPPVFSAIAKKEPFDGYLIEVMETESAKTLSRQYGEDKVLLIRSGSDPYLVLSIAHEIFKLYADAIEPRFLDRFADQASFEQFKALACEARFNPEVVAETIAPEPAYSGRLLRGIKDIAFKLSQPSKVPINIPSVGLSQTSGVVAHSLWGSLLAMLGKYGLNADGSPAGGTLRIPGQINAESEVQGLSRKYFMGRIPMAQAHEAALRMGLPSNAYEAVIMDEPIAALDYSQQHEDVNELVICFGTQFEANMMERDRWVNKLTSARTKLVVIDPIPDPFSIEHAELIIPSPPHPATTKLYQNGEWKLTLSLPQKKAAPETRSDATIIYDAMAAITRKLEQNPNLARQNPDLIQHLQSGYLKKRFCHPESVAYDSIAVSSDQDGDLTQFTSLSQEQLSYTNPASAAVAFIGRHSSNDIVFNDACISKRHAQIRCIDSQARRFQIQDLGSTNGVFLNGKRVFVAEFSLKDKIELGDRQLCPENFVHIFNVEHGLHRINGEVSRVQLWDRIQDYLMGGSGPLYCAFEDDNKQPIRWQDLLTEGSMIYGGVGTTRYRLDYDAVDCEPFKNIYCQPRKFSFFTPTADDLSLPQGIILNSGRSPLSDQRQLIQFATESFNSGKSTSIEKMPDENPLHISEKLAKEYQLKSGDRVLLVGHESKGSVELPVQVNNRLKGDMVYSSFHKSRAQMDKGQYINQVTSHVARCAYSSQTAVKSTRVMLEPLRTDRYQGEETLIGDSRSNPVSMNAQSTIIDTTVLDCAQTLPVWDGQKTPLYVTEIIQETHDVYTFRFQGKPLCRFVYQPGQFCTLVLNINGKKVLRSYTISSTPSRPFVLEITVKRVPGGLVSNWLADHLKVGDPVTIAGPKGKFNLTPGQIPKNILFLAGGSGITPMMSMSRWLCDVSADVSIKFFNSVRSAKDIIYEKEIALLTSRYKLFEPILITSTGSDNDVWMGMKGRINREMLALLVPDLHDYHVYLCGPEGFMASAKQILADLNFNPTNLHSESFGGIRTSAKTVSSQPKYMAPPVIKQAEVTTVDPAEFSSSKPGSGEFKVHFKRSGSTITADADTPILDAAEEKDIDIDYSCRSGSCGQCKCKLIKGEVKMDCDDGLEPAEKEAGYILTCVATAKSDCVIDI